jgi:hypothetical protein
MAVVEFLERAVQLAAYSFGDADAEDESHFVGGEAEQSHFAGALKDPVDREVPFEDEILAVFDLIDRLVALQIDSLAILLRELRTQQPGPVIQPLFNDGGAQFIGGRL